jgi:hypothetical protein
MMATRSSERIARVEDGQVVCPWCDRSDKVWYAEDFTVRHELMVMAGEVRVCPEHMIADQPVNERIYCDACGTSSTLPTDVPLVFERYKRSWEKR